MKVANIIGARPQFIKAAPIGKALLDAGHCQVLIHTGQHYNANMSDIFFEELGIPSPDVNLEIGSGTHGAQTGAMLEGIEEVLLAERPDWALVYGDTNSTLAGALAAAKLHIPVAHVEAGLRSFNRTMPEEINRVVTDHLSNLLLCPSQTAIENLAAEGITHGVHLVGDVMYDALFYFIERARQHSTILQELKVEAGRYLLATIHRAENTDDPARLHNILAAFAQIKETVIFPIHPRTSRSLRAEDGALGEREPQEYGSDVSACDLPLPDNVKIIDAVGYLDMLMLEQHARAILTDSGGVQKEAYWLGVPCVTLRDETEWVETVTSGWNRLAGADTQRIINAVAAMSASMPTTRSQLYGDGNVAGRCVRMLESYTADSEELCLHPTAQEYPKRRES
jgi:UDP-GlcNAc3NAcA epimerase